MGAMQNPLEVDLTDGNFYANGGARDAYRWMRENRPVFRDRNGLAAAAAYRAVMDAERNPQLFSSAGGIRPAYPPMPYMIDMDDPDHLLRRKLVSAAFTGKRVRDKAMPILRMCDELIDAVCESGRCDFVRDIAAPLPMAVVGDMLGVLPEERATLLKWSEELVGGPRFPGNEASVQAVMEAFAAYATFAKNALVKRRTEPMDDLFSVLANAEVDGQRLSDDEIIFESLLILIGGDETTRHTLSGGVEQLLRNRDQWERLRHDRSLLPGAVEEMLRWTSPIKNMCRTLTAATDFHGAHLRAGEKILLMFESANFDERVFDNPDVFRIDRQPNNHLAFGFGTHFCLGNQLARSELSLMVARVLDRLPDLRLADNAELRLRPTNFVTGAESMPVIFTPSNRIASQ
jgi:cytochrome P450 family 142 subfamily A polypeptide 1